MGTCANCSDIVLNGVVQSDWTQGSVVPFAPVSYSQSLVSFLSFLSFRFFSFLSVSFLFPPGVLIAWQVSPWEWASTFYVWLDPRTTQKATQTLTAMTVTSEDTTICYFIGAGTAADEVHLNGSHVQHGNTTNLWYRPFANSET